MVTFEGYILTASCAQCQHTFSVEDVLNRNCSGELEKYIKNIKEYIKTMKPSSPGYEAIKQGKNINLGLSVFHVFEHGGCPLKIENISFCLENMSKFSKQMLIEMKPYNFFELNSHE